MGTFLQGSGDDVVAHAEDVLRDTWLRMLRGECDYTGTEMHAASARCDAARLHLAAALFGRDPDTIAVAYADLEGKLVSSRIAARAYEQAREALDHELGVAYREAVSGQGPARKARKARTRHTLGWLPRHVMFSLIGLAAARRL